MSNKVKIYCLKDPITYEIKYIGKTWVALNERLRLHIVCSLNSKTPTRKEKWIIELASKNLKPIIETIIEVSKDKWRETEREWIEIGKSQGWPLLNLKRGGDGYDNLTHSEEHKQLLRERMKGNKYGVGKKWTTEQRKMLTKSRQNPWNKGKTDLPKHTTTWKQNQSKKISGEKHPMMKLKDSEIIKMRILFSEGLPIKNIAATFNCNYSHAVKIVNYKIRKSCV